MDQGTQFTGIRVQVSKIMSSLGQWVWSKIKKQEPASLLPESASYSYASTYRWNEFPLGIDEQKKQLNWNPVESSHILFSGNHANAVIPNLIEHGLTHPDKWRVYGVDDYRRMNIPNYPEYARSGATITNDLEKAVEMLRVIDKKMMFRHEKMQEDNIDSIFAHDIPYKSLLLVITSPYFMLTPSGIKTDEGRAEDALREKVSQYVEKITRMGGPAGVFVALADERPNPKLHGEILNNITTKVVIGNAHTIVSNIVLGNDKATELDVSIRGRGYYQDQNGKATQFQAFTPTKP